MAVETLLVCLAVFIALSALVIWKGRRDWNRPPQKTSRQSHAPHSGVEHTAEARRLQNGGTIGPGKLGGGADFGPS